MRRHAAWRNRFRWGLSIMRGRDQCPTMDPMTLGIIEHAIGQWEAHLRALGRSPKTIQTRLYWPRRMLTDLGVSPWTVTADDIEGWFAQPHPWKLSSRYIATQGVRQFFAWAVQHGHRDDNPADVLELPRVPRCAKQPISPVALSHAMAAATGSTWWLLRIASTTGLRRAELAQLHSSDVSDGWIIVHGKGDKDRRVPVPEDVEAWIVACDGWCFPSPRGGHLLPGSIAERIERATGCNPHALRRRFATDVYRATHDLRSVQLLLGHASIATTELYIEADYDEVRRAARSVWAA